MLDILQNMPVDERQIEQARLAILKKIETERMAPSEIYWTWRANKELGHPRDLRRDLYERIQDASVQDLLDFQERYVKNRHYTFLVLGDQRSVDLSYLESFGPLTPLSLETVFGY
jgi:predicted Zn-dependent peptidase